MAFSYGTLQYYAQNFINSYDKDASGGVNKTEFLAYLESLGLPTDDSTLVDNAFSIFAGLDTSGSVNKTIKLTQLKKVFENYDLDSDGDIGFEEKINLQNDQFDVYSTKNMFVDTKDVTETQYNTINSNAKNIVNTIDSDKNGEVSTSELKTYLASINYTYDDASVQDLMKYITGNSTSTDFNVLEYINKSIALDNTINGDNSGNISINDILDGAEAFSGGNLRPLTYTEKMAKNYIKSVDGSTGATDEYGNVIKDGIIDKEEIEAYLNKSYMPGDIMSENLIKLAKEDTTAGYTYSAKTVSYYDEDGNPYTVDALNMKDMAQIYNNYLDTNDDEAVSFQEQINFQNKLSGASISLGSQTSTTYTKLFNVAASYVKAVDSDKDGYVSKDELQDYLYTNNYDKNSVTVVNSSTGDTITEGIDSYIEYFAGAASTKFNVMDLVQKYVSLDAGGLLDEDDNPIADGTLQTSEIKYMPKFVQIDAVQKSAKSLITAVDGNTGVMDTDGSVIKDQLVDEKELKTYFDKNNLPAQTAQNLISLVKSLSTEGKLKDRLGSTYTYSASSTTYYDEDSNAYSVSALSWDDLQALYDYFDTTVDNKNGTTSAGADHSLSFNEAVNLANAYSGLPVHSTTTTKLTSTQYSNLMTSAKKFMAYDVNLDGIVDVTEIRAVVDQQNSQLTNDNSNQAIPDGYAENMILAFDKDQTDPVSGNVEFKDGGLDIYEYMQGMLEIQQANSNNTGKTTSVDALVVKDKLYNTKLFASVNEIFTKADSDSNKELGKVELQNYFVSQGLPSTLAGDIINGKFASGADFDTDGDGSISRLEYMKIFSEYDANNNNKLDTDEELGLYNDVKTTGSPVTSSSIKQYTNLYTSLQEYVKANDWSNDSILSSEELKKYYTSQGLPEYFAENVIEKYGQTYLDTKGNTYKGIDLISLFNMHLEFDGAAKGGNEDGINQINEQMKLNEELSNISLGSKAGNITQYASLYDKSKQIFTTYDAQDNDNELNAEELKNYFAAQGLSKDYAAAFINKYDKSGTIAVSSTGTISNTSDGKIDVIEFMQAQVNFDKTQLGSIELNEQLAMEKDLSTVPGAASGTVMDDINPELSNQVQYQNLYNTVKSYFEKYDDSKNLVLNITELKDFFTEQGLSDSLAASFIEKYGSQYNGSTVNNGVDMLHFMNAYAKYDDSENSGNDNGLLEYSEKMKLYEEISGISLGTNTTNASQYSSLYSNAQKIYSTYDTQEDDKQLNIEELKKYFSSQGLSENYAGAFIRKYDVVSPSTGTKDGKIDLMEFMQSQTEYDTKLNVGNYKNGTVDFNELLLMEKELSTVPGAALDNLNPESVNQAQYQALANSVKTYFNSYDTDVNRVLSNQELKQFFTEQGLPASLSDEFISKYGSQYNSSTVNNGIDMLHFMNAFVKFDASRNGSLDSSEMLAFNADISNVTLASASDANVQSLYTAAKQVVKQYDKDSNNILDESELGDYFAAQGVSREIAKEVIGSASAPSYGKDYSVIDYKGATKTVSGIDSIRLLNAFNDFDVARDGNISQNEVIALGAAAEGIDISKYAMYPNAITGSFNAASNIIASYDADKDGVLVNGTDSNGIVHNDLYKYFTSLGMPASIADAFMQTYGTDNNADGTKESINNLELMNALLANDSDASGSIDSNEQINMFAKLAGVSLNVNSANQAQVQSLMGYAQSIMGGKGEIDQQGIRNYFASKQLPASMADKFYNDNKNASGKVDIMKFTSALVSIDNAGSKQDGSFDFLDLVNLYNTSVQASEQISINTSNQAQVYSLWNYAQGQMGGKGEFDRQGIINYFAAQGIPATIADKFYNDNKNASGTVDIMKFVQTLVNVDNNGTKQDGSFDFLDLVNLYNTSTQASEQISINTSNQAQVNSLWNYAQGQMGGKGQFTEQDVINYFAAYGKSATMAENFYNANKNAGGTVDIMKFVQTLVNIDNSGTKQDGSFDAADWEYFFNQFS